MRTPHFIRDMIYNPFTCDLNCATNSGSIYRISLEEGKFLNAFETMAKGNHCIDYSKYLNLLFTGGEEGIMGIWDYRTRTRA